MKRFREDNNPSWLSSAGNAIVGLGLRRPKSVIFAAVVITLALGALITGVEIDTDPENMLKSDDPTRVLNSSVSDDFGTRNMIMLGIISDRGKLTPKQFAATAQLIDDIKTIDGTVPDGVISFMSTAKTPPGPLSNTDIATIESSVEENALLAGRVISANGTGLAVFIPLKSKGEANNVASSINELVDKSRGLDGTEHYLAGLPLAEEAFGHDMFLQMAVLAPLAGMLIFLLMFYFFRKISFAAAAMALTMLSVIWTMGLLIGSGFSLHIMSSMIPIFLMPIAILDSVHVLSEFFDRYPRYKDRHETLRAVYKELFLPITFTSLTTAVAFVSLTLAPIPPVQVFGAFIAIGVFFAWALTMLFLPAFVMLLSEDSLQRISTEGIAGGNRILTGGLKQIGRLTTNRPWIFVVGFILILLIAVPGVTQISVNDNPVRWFKSGSEIRKATEELTREFNGTYNASLILKAERPGTLTNSTTIDAVTGLQRHWTRIDVVGQTTTYADLPVAQLSSKYGPIRNLITPDHREANLQLTMKEGDNQAMQRVVDRTNTYLDEHPLPVGISTAWAGETYLNLVWQDKMVSGMLKAFLSTLGVVLLLMLVLFRSLRWAALSMLPVLGTILVVYGVAGYGGKDYDMPMAVLSTLVLGIGVDFAIHFVQRYRELRPEFGSTAAALQKFFEEPARALTRNALIIVIGFIPLFFATLVPYLVVGALLTSIIIVSWIATLLVLPALVTLFSRARKPSRTSRIKSFRLASQS